MQMVGRLALLLPLLSETSATLTLSRTGTPVEKVVHLLTDLKDGIERDREEEKKLYDKYACWCTSTSSRKAKAIHKARDDLKTLGSEILALKSETSELQTEIAETISDIKDNEESQNEAAETRAKEKAEAKQAVENLEKLYVKVSNVLKDVLEGSNFIQSDASMFAAHAEKVRAALADLPDTALVNLSPKTLSMLKDVELNYGTDSKDGKKKDKKGKGKGDDDEAEDKEKEAEEQAKKSKENLEKILDAVDKEIKKQKLDIAEEEKGLDEDFADLMATKTKEVNELQKSISQKEKRKAEAEVELAAATQEYDDTDDQMRRDVEFFDSMKESCEAKEEQWTEREDLRNSELDGIKSALEILTSDEAREMFAKAIKPGMETFIQVSAHENDPVKAAADKAYNVVRMLSSKADDKKALQFAKLAVKIREGKGARDQFADVLAEIDKIIQNLKDEHKEDTEKRDECKENYQEIASTVADLNWKIEKNEAKIAKLEDMIAEKEKEKAATIEEIEAVEKDIEEMEERRKTENEEFEQAKSDDENAVDLLHQARDALKQFYEDNDIDMGELQEPALLAKWGITRTKAKKVKEPEFERDEHDDPDADFSDKGNRKTQTKGILSLLSMIAEDLEDEIKNSEKAEELAVKTYEKELKLANDLKDDLIEKKEGLEETIDKHTSAKTDEEDDKEDNEDSKKSENDYKADIKPDCDFIIKAFHYRRERRDMEIDGLTKAKAMLRGAAPPGAFLDKTPVKAHLRH